MKITYENFQRGLEVQLEHGFRFPEAHATNNHPILTGKILLAHSKESLDHYQPLEVADIEGDNLSRSLLARTFQRFRFSIINL